MKVMDPLHSSTYKRNLQAYWKNNVITQQVKQKKPEVCFSSFDSMKKLEFRVSSSSTRRGMMLVGASSIQLQSEDPLKPSKFLRKPEVYAVDKYQRKRWYYHKTLLQPKFNCTMYILVHKLINILNTLSAHTRSAETV